MYILLYIINRCYTTTISRENIQRNNIYNIKTHTNAHHARVCIIGTFSKRGYYNVIKKKTKMFM